MNNLPIPKETLDDLCEHRTKALDLYGRAVDLFQAARKEARMAAPTAQTDCLSSSDFERLHYWPGDFVKTVRENLDSYMWRHMLKASGVGDLMDATAKEDFAKSLEKDPPEATFGNVAATLATLAAKAPHRAATRAPGRSPDLPAARRRRRRR
jgi:hypothetical protein